MNGRNSIKAPTTRSIASYVKKHAHQVRKAQKHHHEMVESLREADYKGHHIAVRTSYEIEVDGTPITGHVGVSNDGRVHYHPVPNMSFASAIDLVKQLIDVFPDDFEHAGRMPGPHDHPMPMTHGARGATRRPKTRKAKSSRRH